MLAARIYVSDEQPPPKKGRGRPPKNPRSRFGEWLASQREWTAASLAEQIGVTESYIYSLAGSRKWPSRMLAQAIEWTTKGAFPVSGWEKLAGKEVP
jgi:hypothetical protein